MVHECHIPLILEENVINIFILFIPISKNLYYMYLMCHSVFMRHVFGSILNTVCLFSFFCLKQCFKIQMNNGTEEHFKRKKIWRTLI